MNPPSTTHTATAPAMASSPGRDTIDESARHPAPRNGRPASSRAWTASLLLMAWAGAAALHAADEPELVSLINSQREGGGECGGRAAESAPALTSDPRLAGIAPGAVADPMGATRATGYNPAKVQIIGLSGPGSPQEAMAMLAARYCEVLLDAKFTDIGVARDGSRWQVALARPLIGQGLGDWREAGQAVLEKINQARAQERFCGSTRHEPAGPLRWNDELARAALAHAGDMGELNYFSHVSRSGDTLSDRVDETGYSWRRIGENIAAGAGSPAQVMAGWLDSPTHCSTLMNPEFAQSGVAYAIDEDSDAVIYWVQVFGTPE